MKKNQKTILLVSVFLVVVLAIAAIWFFTKPQTTVGAKSIQIEVVSLDKTSEKVEIKTDAEFLRQALEEAKLVEGEESSMGLMVTSVKGTKADDAKQQWWCFTKGGEAVNTGVDSTPIANGDKFEITLTEGY